MSSPDWQDLNVKYLAASIDWLVARLHSLAPVTKESFPLAMPLAAMGTVKPKWAFGKKNAAPQPALAPGIPVLETRGPISSQELADTAKARDLAAQNDPPPALLQLAKEFNLSEFERDVLLLCAAVEFDARVGALIAKVAAVGLRDTPTFGLAMVLFENPHWDALSASRPLRNARLLEVNQPGSTPLTQSGLRVDERVLGYLRGINVLDDRLTGLVTEVPTDVSQPLSASQEAVGDRLLDELHRAIVEGVLPILQLTGPDGGAKLALAARTCGSIGSRLFRVAAEAIPTTTTETESFARLWQRETCLMPIALYIEADELDGAATELQNSLIRLLAKGIGMAVVGVRETPLKVPLPTIVYEVGKPEPGEQLEAWNQALGSNDDQDPAIEQLAGQFELSLSEINDVAARATRSATEEQPAPNLAWNLCRDLCRPQLDELAARIDAKAVWDTIILPVDQTRLMRAIVGQVRGRYQVYNQWGFGARMNRGLGISALFAGESGTGKTMAAEVIANDLNLSLYRIDLSQVVSKYIGETEKNLRRLFDAAEKGGAILFFDEADALFGKRSEVKDSHDRYANIEINYLLQRMESFSGLAILATNMKSALDQAFMRRLRFVVNFPFPTPADRKLIWQKALPAATPQEELDFDRLAKLSITGANIQSIALNAAFIAAGAGTAVTMPVVLTAAYTELRKLDKQLTEAELR